MRNKIAFLSVMVVFVLTALVGPSFAIRLLTKEKALIAVFGPGTQIVTETKILAGDKLAKIRERLNGSLVYIPKGSSQKFEEKTKVDFHFALKDGKKAGVAIIDEQPGKWGPVEFIIALDQASGAVKKVEVMNYEEKRGRPIARPSFVSQYEGKTSKDKLEVGKDITGISGATISSNCATFAVKKAIIMYEEIYLK